MIAWVAKHKLLTAAVAAVVAWLIWRARKKPMARVQKELEIDANVLSPTFGLPIGDDTDARATSTSIFSRTFGRPASIDELNRYTEGVLYDEGMARAMGEDEP